MRCNWLFASMCGLAVVGTTTSDCATASFPWPAKAPPTSAVRADVATVNPAYRRLASRVLVRRISRPTRASLDYAAYHANFMNADLPPEDVAVANDRRPDAAHPFGGVLVPGTLTGSVAATALSADERAHPLALPPLVELLVSKKIPGGNRLEEVVARIRSEDWGLGGGPQLVRQTATEAFLHDRGEGQPTDIWIKVELAPWWHGFPSPPDEDRDGVPEIYGRIAPAAIGAPDAIARFVRTDYEGRVLTVAEVKTWAHQLASYWYPSYNTDLVAATNGWPTRDTEAAVRAELGPLTFSSPSVVMRGKPQGAAVYNVFLVDGAAPDAGPAAAAPRARLELPTTTPSADTAPIAWAITAALAAHGGSWAAWSAEVAPFHATLRRRLDRMPSGSRAIAGSDGFLFYRNSMTYVLGGDLGNQKEDRNPIPAIVAFAKLMARHGVDFLFVPVPTKVEIFPDKIAERPDRRLASFAGQVVNPFARKLLLDLAEQGVETVDLLPPLLKARTAEAAGEALYQSQDTHWTTRGLELVAHLVAERVKRYPWYAGIAVHRQALTIRNESFTRHGDLYARLPEADRARLPPETLVGHQVMGPDGTPYEDDPESPIVLLGDSFAGVYELMDCEHAGVSAHIARAIGYPVDLVMSYGGGPNVREKLLRRGLDKLAGKRLVVWMMTARDLYNYADGWQRLDEP